MEPQIPIDDATIQKLKVYAEERADVADHWRGPDPRIDTTLWPAGVWKLEVGPDGSWSAMRVQSHVEPQPIELADDLLFSTGAWADEYVEVPIGEDAIFRGDAATADELAKHKGQADASDSSPSDEASKTEAGDTITIEVEADAARFNAAIQSVGLAMQLLLLRHEAAAALVHMSLARESLRRALRDGVLSAPVLEAMADLERAARMLQREPR